MWPKFCGFLLRLMGWTVDGGPVPEDKAIILGVPHTSVWDFVVSYLFYRQFGTTKARCMVKKEFFVWPLRGLLRALGAIPTDRKNATTLVMSMISAMEKEDKFILAIAPEGTRKPVRKWKTGYHLIAKAAGVPVYLGYFNWGTKHIGCGVKFELSDDARADTERIQAYYETLGLKGKHPGQFLTH